MKALQITDKDLEQASEADLRLIDEALIQIIHEVDELRSEAIQVLARIAVVRPDVRRAS